MSVKPETQFANGVNGKLPPLKVLHREKMNNPYRGGTADWWYSGRRADLWCEFKFLPRIPQRGIIDSKRLGFSALQLEWLRGRYEEGRNVCAIIGCPSGGVILRHLEWEKQMTPQQFVERLMDRKALARWIAGSTTHEAA